MHPFAKAAVILAFLGLLGTPPLVSADFRYLRVGSPSDASGITPRAGFALMGGGDDLDEAFRWLCERGGGGDFLILRATNNDEYNPYVQKLCHVNSVATLVLPSRTAAMDPEAAKIITRAHTLFISGGDQANYINFWMGTPVQTALNDAIRRGIPMGGTSAGLAVMGEYAYSAQGDKPDDPNLDSKTALRDASHPRITLVHGFLDIPILRGIITDSHFAKRDRMGRLLVFVARINESGAKEKPPPGQPAVRAIGVDERSAILLEPDGKAKVIGPGRGAYFVDPIGNAFFADLHNRALFLRGVTIQKVAPGQAFNLKTWAGESSSYRLSANQGKLRSTQAGGAIY